MKLSPAQMKALRELRDDTRHGFRNATSQNRTGQALSRLGLIEWRAGRHFGGRFEITAEGLSALRAERGE